MEIVYNQSKNQSVVMTLGSFDGIHLGHQRLINLAINRAQELSCDSALFTFKPHPLKVIAPKRAPKSLTSWLQQRKIISSLGINQIISKKFTKTFSQMPFDEFVINYLVNRFSVREIIVGEDFRCGYKSKGTPAKLAQLGKEFGFEVEAISAVKVDNQEASSTYIRQLIMQGAIKKVKEQLGRNYKIDCRVIKGDQRGRKLGFPTANLNPVTNYALPPAGVYACRVYLEGKVYQGIANLGLRPTFAKEEFAIEVHIFNFNGQIYNKRLELEFLDKIRGERKFSTKQELIARIKKDVKLAKKILN